MLCPAMANRITDRCPWKVKLDLTAATGISDKTVTSPQKKKRGTTEEPHT
jgi:hypothetical protein